MTGVLIKRGLLDTKTGIDERQCKETQDEDSQGEMPGTDPSLTALRRHQLGQHLDLGLLVSRM